MAAESEWSTNKNITNSLKDLYISKAFSDVIFMVGPADSKETPREIKAHRLVCSSRSPVMAEMLNGRRDIVKISDMSADTFEVFLKLVCTKQNPRSVTLV